MKKWQILLVSLVAAVAVLVVSGLAFYKLYLVPKYVSPVLDKVQKTLQDDDVLDSLYDVAVRVHDEGVLTDDNYNNFIETYRKHSEKNDVEVAKSIIEQKEQKNNEVKEGSKSVTVKYASSQVGITMIQENDGDKEGKSSMRYGTERTSDRINSEDVIEAEKTLAEAEAKEEDDGTDSDDLDAAKDIQSKYSVDEAYKVLKENMSTKEWATFVSIIGKLDVNVLKGYAGNYDYESVKDYLHANLSDSEYTDIVNLGYKYMGLFM